MSLNDGIKNLGAEVLEKIGFESENIVKWKGWLQKRYFLLEYPDEPYAWRTYILH
ncbi:hypothetical protein [Methanosarcina barkeri]|uniref:Putative cytosine deaminase n=1 Tax=Methanosarcina barkeri (strain Fusaro / DSM 804) TaxID=269797 RepID=Q467P5_METBF|nr:hypothetical protein [Methanosarcina barkeri]